MLLEGLAKRILGQMAINREPPIDIQANHQRIGDMLDKIHDDEVQFNKRRKMNASMDVLKKKLNK